MAIACKELFDAKRSSTIVRPDQNDISEPLCYQLDSAKDESPHQYIAQLTVCLYERNQMFAIKFDNFARFDHPYLDKSTTSREHIYLTCEHTRLDDGHQFFCLF